MSDSLHFVIAPPFLCLLGQERRYCFNSFEISYTAIIRRNIKRTRIYIFFVYRRAFDHALAKFPHTTPRHFAKSVRLILRLPLWGAWLSAPCSISQVGNRWMWIIGICVRRALQAFCNLCNLLYISLLKLHFQAK